MAEKENKKKKRRPPPVCFNMILLQYNKKKGETVKKRWQLLKGFLPEIQNSNFFSLSLWFGIKVSLHFLYLIKPPSDIYFFFLFSPWLLTSQ